MKKLSLSLLLLFSLSFSLIYAQPEPIPESCTSIMVGKNASVDGSVMTAHSCDANYRTWVRVEPREKHVKGDMHPVYWGTLHNEEPFDMRNVTKKGEVPEIEGETYRYLNVAYPCMNEKQLAIGETTTSGRRELYNGEGLFLIEELERLALQRCSNARDAIKLMGKMAQTYGYGDWGECLTVADKNEVWHFEIYGSGEGKPSAMWVAQRIPDDHVGISANIPRIGKVDFKNPDFFMYSDGLKENAKRLNLWDGKSDFIFYKVASQGKPFSIREFHVLSTLAPSLNLSMEADELPFSVKPEKKVSQEDMFAFYRASYEGLDYDQTKNLWVEVARRTRLEDGTIQETKDTVKPISAFMTNDMRALLNKLEPDITQRTRTIAVIQCSYSHVIRLRNWLPDEVGGVAYFAFDNPAQSPRIPIWCGTTSLPASFAICGQHRYREDAAIWAFRETNRIATIDWNKTRTVMEPEVLHLEKLMMNTGETIEKEALELIKSGSKEEAEKVLTKQTEDFASLAMQKWQDMKGRLWMFFVRSM